MPSPGLVLILVLVPVPVSVALSGPTWHARFQYISHIVWPCGERVYLLSGIYTRHVESAAAAAAYAAYA